VILKIIPKTKREEIPPNSFYKAGITLLPKPDEDATKKKKKKSIEQFL
jgi:hypothetical protein